MARCRPERLQLTAHSHRSDTTASSSDEIWRPKEDRGEDSSAGDRKANATFLKNRSRPHTPWAGRLSAQTRRGPHASPRLPALFAAHSVSLLAYLVPVLAGPQSEDSVTEGVEGVAEVGALEAMAVQHLQSVEHPSDGEAYATEVAKGTLGGLLRSGSQTRVSSSPRPFPKRPSYFPFPWRPPAVASWHLSKDQRTSTACPRSLICCSISRNFARTCETEKAGKRAGPRAPVPHSESLLLKARLGLASRSRGGTRRSVRLTC